jgi:hypothetical protein
VIAAPATITASAGVSQATITVTVLDANSNPIEGATVSLAATGANNALSQPAATDAAGQTVATLSSTTAGAKIISATVNQTLPITDDDTVMVQAGGAAIIAITGGDGLAATVGAPVGTAPAVRVTDAFDNPVSGETVTFTVTGGGGDLTGATPATDENGVAAVTAWTVGDGVAMSDTGTFANTLDASSTAGTVSFSARARYSYATHVQPVWSPCTGCHGGTAPTLTAGVSYGNLVDQDASCNAGFKRVPLGGGTAAETGSLLMARMNGDAVAGCGGVMPPSGALSAASRDIVRAWIRNGAPNN